MKPRYDGSEDEGKSKRYNFTTNKAVSEILEPIKNKANFIREAIVFYHKNKDLFVNTLQQIKNEATRPLPIRDRKDSPLNNPKFLETIPTQIPLEKKSELEIKTINVNDLGLNDDNIILNGNPKEFLESYNRPLLAKFYAQLLNKSAPKKKPYIIRGILNHYRSLGKL